MLSLFYFSFFIIINLSKSEEIKRKLDTCTSKIPNCEICSDSETCSQCKDNFNLMEDNTCLYFTLVYFKYYYDDSSGKYLSCNNIDNCIECSSSTACTKCKNGYKLDGSSCTNEIKKIKRLGIAAVVLSSIVIVVEIVLLVLYLLNKISIFGGKQILHNTTRNVDKSLQSDVENVQEVNLEKSAPNDDQNSVAVHNEHKRKSIHNVG